MLCEINQHNFSHVFTEYRKKNTQKPKYHKYYIFVTIFSIVSFKERIKGRKNCLILRQLLLPRFLTIVIITSFWHRRFSFYFCLDSFHCNKKLPFVYMVFFFWVYNIHNWYNIIPKVFFFVRITKKLYSFPWLFLLFENLV